jgi:ribosomal protein L5
VSKNFFLPTIFIIFTYNKLKQIQTTMENRDYSNKVTYWMNQLNKELNAPLIDKQSIKMQKALDSLNYFTKKQIEIEKGKILKMKVEALENHTGVKEWMNEFEAITGQRIINKNEF